ncbi:capsid maturation protease [Gordonia phage JKSyngboy]|uniref:Capsid maturation protease n=1 Tax=Gordonia phage JKSyngboy TaxID=2762400 RepID=A0A7G8LL68_9CAUD|nr:head maturation protease [Gordonia phage JKSyngboy]QNJ57990.1 capsid maturation protease [Gordonia phage JKSyngboy]
MGKNIGAALNAANIVYDRADFADPKLDRLTPIQVTKDGRVFGHLAGWNSEHIGRPGVRPPRGTDYRYFHQGVVPTTDGDLAVGHLTLGTGHAAAGNINAAASHYDDTGSQVAQVRVGEDAHGIWFAGRTSPTTDDLQRQTLRRSSLSGDWRKVQGQYELVAALAVNVPGFPIPRTDLLVASGADDGMLVAAGMVRNGPITHEEVHALVASAGRDAQAAVDRAIRRERLRQRTQPLVDEIVASARVEKRRALTASAAKMRRQQAGDQYLSILAAGVDTSGRMPPALHRYWTKGVGLARWASTGTPFRSLVSALESEIPDMSPAHLKGLAANLYHDVFKQWPGRKSAKGGALTASAMPPTPDEAQAMLDDPEVQAVLAALPVPGVAPEVVPEPVPEDVAEVEPRTDGMIALLPAITDTQLVLVDGGDPDPHLTLIYVPDVVSLDDISRNSILSTVTRIAETRQPIIGDLFARAEFNAGSDDKDQCAVWLVNGADVGRLHDDLRAALGDRVPPSEYGAFVPHITAGYNMAADRLPVGESVTFDRVRVSFAGENVDIPLGAVADDEALLGEVQTDAADVPEFGDPEAWEAVQAAGDRRKVKTQAGADKYGVSIGDVIGRGIDDAVDGANSAVDKAQADAANLGKSVAEALFGKRPAPKDDQPEQPTPPPAPAPAPEPKRAAPQAAPAQIVEAPTPSQKPRAYDPNDPTPVQNHAGETESGTASDVDVRVQSDVEPRMDVGAGTDHPMAEDESPLTGAEGGELVEYSDGVATYSDGTQTDGTVWTRSPVLPGMGYDGETLLEDQAPLKGAEGGELVSFDGDRGVAVYDDGTETDGKQWTKTGAVMASAAWSAITAAAGRRGRITAAGVGKFDELKHKRDARGKFARKSVGELTEIRAEKMSIARSPSQPMETRLEAKAEAEAAGEVIAEKGGGNAPIASRPATSSEASPKPMDPESSGIDPDGSRASDSRALRELSEAQDARKRQEPVKQGGRGQSPEAAMEQAIAEGRPTAGEGNSTPRPLATGELPEPPDWSQVDAEPVVGATDTIALRRQLDALSTPSPNGDSWERYETGTEALFLRDAQESLAGQGLRLTRDDQGYLQVWREDELTASASPAWQAITAAAGRRR